MRIHVATLAIAGLVLSACGSASEDADASTDTDSPATTPGVYVPVSDVTSHAAIGQDAAAARAAMEPAEEGGLVDWTAVAAAIEKGGASVKGDGTVRTIAALAEDHPALAAVNAALTGNGDAPVRRQQVDKGITVLLAAKVADELDAAAEKLADGNTDKEEGAPHNVDEAWAFFVAEDQGPAVTADKRAADFGLEGKVREPIIDALTDAQQAAIAGDEEAYTEAADQVRAGLNYVFYLATYKYLDHEADDTVHKAEGMSFFLGIQPLLEAEASDAAEAIAAAYTDADTQAGRAALNSPASIQALGLSGHALLDD
jgi:hypothetical protein